MVSGWLYFQNNLDELFMLMHFLDAGKVNMRAFEEWIVLVYIIIGFGNWSLFYYLQFGSLEEFQEEFRDINQEEQISRLHKMLAPHLLRSKNF